MRFNFISTYIYLQQNLIKVKVAPHALLIYRLFLFTFLTKLNLLTLTLPLRTSDTSFGYIRSKKFSSATLCRLVDKG